MIITYQEEDIKGLILIGKVESSFFSAKGGVLGLTFDERKEKCLEKLRRESAKINGSLILITSLEEKPPEIRGYVYYKQIETNIKGNAYK